MNLHAFPNNHSMGTYLPRGVDHLGFIEAKLRDLRGFATLAHELIQNADDAKANAKLISFNVCDDALIVDNDGKFSDCGEMEERNCPWKYDSEIGHSCDFHRFRNVASRDKREEEGTTGAFGIGFIAVYQIADHPEVISGNRHWLLHDEESEDKRIQVCPGCEQCQNSDLPGTRFILPWAYDPNSSLRKELRAESVVKEDQIALIQDLESKLPVAMLFLKNIERIELRKNGELNKYFERLPLEDQLIITDGNTANDRIWNIFKGVFKEHAQRLRDKHPGRIEPKRSHTVHIAIPEETEPLGRFCVCLPTEHDTGLPFHINADFYPSSDRKKIILESDYQSQWNYAAIEGAAETLANSFNQLPKVLGHKNLWELISSIHKVGQEAEAGKRHTKLATFWKKLSPVLKSSPIAYTENKKWVTPSEAFLLRDKEEEDVLPIFNAFDIEIVHRDIRPYIFQLPWHAVLGMKQLDLEHLIEAFQENGFTEKREIASLPEILQSTEGRDLLHRQIIRLLRRQRSPDKKRALEEELSKCAIILSRDNALWPCSQVYQAKEKTISLFSKIDPGIPFLADMGEENADIVKLCPIFSAKVAVDCLEKRLGVKTQIDHDKPEINPKEVLDWFEARRDEILNKNEVKKALTELPIYPGPKGKLFPLNNLALPGGFEDPIGITEIVDLKPLGGKREFLQELGAKPLSFNTYAKEHIPCAFEIPQLSIDKKRSVVLLLARKLGEITGDRDIQNIISALVIVECEDHEFREPEEVYFPEIIVRKVLASGVPIAEIPTEHEHAIGELYDWLGVSRVPRASDIIERVYTLITAPPKVETVDTVIAILDFLGDIYRRERELSEEFEQLKSIQWLPARGIKERWYKPEKLYTSFRDYLFESQGLFLDVTREKENVITDFLKWLGVNTEPTPLLVVKHLLNFSEQNKPVNKEVYSYLNNKTDDVAIQQLKGKKCLLLHNNQYVTADHVFWGEHPFGRFRYRLSHDMRKYNDLLDMIGVRERAEPEDALDVIMELAQQYGTMNQPLDDEAHAVCLTCWRILSEGLDEGKITKEELLRLSNEKVIPDVRRILKTTQRIFFEDRAGIASKFGDFLKNDVIPRPQGAWKAMTVAGVRILSTAVEVRVLECTDPIEDPLLTSKILNRKSQFARVLEPLRESVTPENALSALGQLTYFQSQKLKIQYLLRLFNRELESEPEAVPAFCHIDKKSLYFIRKNGSIPWASIARELALAISHEVDPGQLASGIKEVLSAESDQDAQMILDELGFAPIETTKPGAPLSDEIVDDFGGDEIQVETGPSTQTGEQPGVETTEKDLTPGEALDSIFGEAGVLPTTSTQPTTETDISPGVTGEPSPVGRDKSKQKVKGSRKKHGKLRTYVYPEGIESEDDIDSEGFKQRSQVDQAGINHVIEFEKKEGRQPKVMPQKHPGYDVESKDLEEKIIRYIEVKSLSGDWDEGGAALTKTQFEKAQECGGKFWLYVVERAQSQNYQVYPIQDPGQRVNQFIYDDGWKNLVSDDFTFHKQEEGIRE